ncbi:HsdR family type I site-specific deoxyribonuclease [Maritimibacter sp. DP07]|uniref:Type I restriction enzyme endonuclease subunit n=1 Tax=Maritimibacter harenae TaxID=2606218 RepID=A0A845M544_9RHOB|nr:type I restriction endonuclease subunit R [Maritimibacter harenae]MZR14332.1 HsdR family type I site-specific deoxyribonuclease [Maritimibacter harenae]
MAWSSEADLENWMLEKLAELGFRVRSGADISPEARDPERRSFHDSILKKTFREAVARLNPELSEGAVAEVVSKVNDDALGGDLVAENRRMHDLMIRGVPIEYFHNGEERSGRARLIDWTDENNVWEAINQVDMVGRVARIPDVVLYLNGLPLVVVELKGTEGADIDAAFTQIENYKADIPNLFRSTVFSVVSDGINARYGTLSANWDRFMQWRTIDGEKIVRENEAIALGTLTDGLLNRRTLLDMLRWFVVFEDEGTGAVKKAAGYHQFHAVRKAVDSIVAARGDDGKGGVIWHTQGSGKSLLMTFLAGRVMHLPALENPTIVVLTDRNDLDNQLFTTFGRCRDLLGEDPVQADSIEDLKRLLNREVGGIVFSTIQKFRPERGHDFPELTNRSNVIVMVDEAHRTQYGFDAKIDEKSGEVRHGLAHHLRTALPNAVYVAFTGTPVELIGANTRSVFGDYIDVYDIAQAVEDGATVPIFYEGRVARIELDSKVQQVLDEEFDEATEGLAEEEANAAARRWSGIEKLVGAPTRLDAVVADILEHFDARLEAIDGKAMIVCMSRRICVEVYERIVAARPEWHADTDEVGAVKVVMTGSATDPANFQTHIRNKGGLEALRRRYKDVTDPLKLVIVRDMWLTGFDAPCMHTLYVDKPMRGHGLMQAIARVNRVFSGKPAGLVVDYIGLAAELKNALAHYSQGDQEQTGVDEREAVAAFLTALEVARGVFHGFDYSRALGGSSSDRIEILPKAANHVLERAREEAGDNSKDFGKRFMDAVANLAKAFKLAAGSSEASQHAEEVAFFLAVRSALQKMDVNGGRKGFGNPDFAIEQLLNRAVASTEVIDILEACGFDRPDISVLSEEFLLEIQNMEHKNLAVEALKKLLNGEISARTRGNVVQNEKFSERLTSAISRYHNRSVDALQVIQELIALAKDLQAEPPDNLTSEERSFYDALAQNESAVEVLGNEELRIIATELVNSVRDSSGVDWWERDDVRAKMRVAVKRILRRHGYPPDLQAEAVKLVIKQAEAMARNAA